MFFTIFSLVEHARDVLELFSEIEEWEAKLSIVVVVDAFLKLLEAVYDNILLKSFCCVCPNTNTHENVENAFVNILRFYPTEILATKI
jgi:hypothetical protein